MKGNFGHPSAYEGKPVEKYIEIFAELAEQLPKGLSVTDLFGGVGRLSKRLWDVLEPGEWESIEIDPTCIDRWEEPRAHVINGDAFLTKEFFDLVIIDPHKGTLNSIMTDPAWQELFSRIQWSGAKYVLMQEYGAYWCHLPNQKKIYKDHFGVEIDKSNYRDYFSDYMREKFNFHTIDSRIGLGSCYYLMEVK